MIFARMSMFSKNSIGLEIFLKCNERMIGYLRVSRILLSVHYKKTDVIVYGIIDSVSKQIYHNQNVVRFYDCASEITRRKKSQLIDNKYGAPLGIEKIVILTFRRLANNNNGRVRELNKSSNFKVGKSPEKFITSTSQGLGIRL
jgi:hypothetical protein